MSAEEFDYHTPALLRESVGAMLADADADGGGIYVDVTLGGGGHTRAILRAVGRQARLIAFDRDADAIARAEAIDDPRFCAVHSNFCHMANWLDYLGVMGRVDGILADLGVSSHHFDEADRGFSFRADGPLDMRMNRRGALTAAALVATATAEELTRIFSLYGEFKQAGRLARALVDARATAPVTTTEALVALAEPMIRPDRRRQELAQIFQALRIAVNGEMEALEAFLTQSIDALRPGGRLAVISYHSLEDRMVKNFMRTGRIDGREEKDLFGRSSAPLKPLTGKPIVPPQSEIDDNPRSRSAKLRVAVKL